MQSDSIGKLAAALAKAQGLMKGASKDALNPHFKARYSSLDSVWEACRDALSVNELAIVQTLQSGDSSILKTTLVHSSGEFIESFVPVLLGARQDMQALGSAITYARRYGISSMVGVCPSDETEDDGEAAVGRVPPPLKAPPRPVLVKEVKKEIPLVSPVADLYLLLVKEIRRLTNNFQDKAAFEKVCKDLGVKDGKQGLMAADDVLKQEWLDYLVELK